ncbi:bactofilin family protein [Myroides odoratus]|uniref:bactofilin family protein n=1 Tax=Myroides odoratus TaxID=256 RepID=UPI0039B0BEAD
MFEKSIKKAKGTGLDLLGQTNRIVEGTTIKGNIEAIADIRIDGVIEGNVEVKGRLVLGPIARIKGDIRCENSEIEGEIEGNIVVNDLLTVKSTAKIKGDIKVGRLAVEPGAKIDVKCQMVGCDTVS